MKTFWVWLRVLLDVLGALMLGGMLLLAWLAFSPPRYDADESTTTAKPAPNYSHLLLQSGVTDAHNWQHSGIAGSNRCNDENDGYLLSFQHRQQGRQTKLPADWQSTQQLSPIGNLMWMAFRQSSCAKRLPAGLIGSHGRPMQLRVNEADWWNGRLTSWRVYLYDSSNDSITIWTRHLPP